VLVVVVVVGGVVGLREERLERGWGSWQITAVIERSGR
jgi:hypothetical protein